MEENNDVLCPMLAQVVGLHNPSCMREGCAWWYQPKDEGEGMCALVGVAQLGYMRIELEHIAYKLGGG